MKNQLLANLCFAAVPAALLLAPTSSQAVSITLGAKFEYSGTLNGGAVSGSIYDKDIHSGVFRSALGTSSDSYVLQGGDPYGGDTGDAFEVSQSRGHAVSADSFFDIFTDYDFGQPATQAGTFIASAPDTGWLTFHNKSGYEFKGTIKLSGQAFGGIYGPAQFFSNSGPVDLLDGEEIAIVLNNESSNYGGYNHPDAIPDAGSTLALLGLGVGGLSMIRRRFVA